MINIESETIEIEFFYNDYKYKLRYNKINNELNIYEQYDNDKYIELNFITIKDNYVTTYYETCEYNKYIEGIIQGTKKDLLLKRINEAFNNSSIIKDVFNIEKFNKFMKNILINDEIIALCNPSLKNIEENDLYIIDIVLLETNSIIGSIKYNHDDINIDIDKKYINNVIVLLNKILAPVRCKNTKKHVLKMEKELA